MWLMVCVSMFLILKGFIMRTYSTVPTALRHAFDNIKVKDSASTSEGSRIGAIIYEKLNTKCGTVSRPDWVTNLTTPTAKRLDAPVFNPQRKPAIPELGKDYSIWNQVVNTGGFTRMVG